MEVKTEQKAAADSRKFQTLDTVGVWPHIQRGDEYV